MSLRAKTKYIAPSKPAHNAGMTLFCSADAIPCHWARLVLAEKDVDSARIEIQKPGRVSEDLLVLNPEQILPTLTDREAVIYPARVIVEYLDERYPHPPMLPAEPSARARLRMVMDRLEQDFFSAVVAIEQGPPAAARAARKRLTDHLLSSARLFPARGWFLGMSDYSVVDCAWVALFWRLSELQLVLPAGADPIRHYSQRAFARPSFARSLAKPAPPRK